MPARALNKLGPCICLEERTEPARLKFLIQAVYDVLSSPSNLHCRGRAKNPCMSAVPGKRLVGTYAKLLPPNHARGRYSLCHDQVLKAVADNICNCQLKVDFPRQLKRQARFDLNIRVLKVGGAVGTDSLLGRLDSGDP